MLTTSVNSKFLISDLTYESLRDQAEASIKNGSKSFRFASMLFNRSIRTDVYMLYSWCRYCDDQIDEAPDGESEQRVKILNELTHSAINQIKINPLDTYLDKNHFFKSNRQESLPFLSLAVIAHKYQIPELYFDELLKGMKDDSSFKTLLTLKDLKVYCYRVAGVVGLMMSHIMGVNNQKALAHAEALGQAMQLTNICRDIFTDAKINRCYLPLDILEKFNLNENNYLDLPNRDNLYNLTKHLLELANSNYSYGLKGIKYLDLRSALTISIAAFVYQKIGTKLLKNPQLIQRSYTSFFEKWICFFQGTFYWFKYRIIKQVISQKSLKKPFKFIRVKKLDVFCPY